MANYNYCGKCINTDEYSYVSNPPQVRCKLTQTLHQANDICDTEYSKSKIQLELNVTESIMVISALFEYSINPGRSSIDRDRAKSLIDQLRVKVTDYINGE